MNNNQSVEVLLCSKCGNELSINNASFCTKCGNKIDMQCDEQNNDFSKQVAKPEKNNKSGIVFLILSIINLFTGVPFVIYFLVVWLLFGAFTNDANLYYGILLFGCGYISASIIGVVSFIVNLIAKGRHLSVCFIVMFIGFIIGVIAPVIFVNSDYSPDRNNMVQNSITEEKIIFEDDDLIIKQQKISYEKSYVEVYFSLETQNIDNYSLPSYLTVHVNQCKMNARLNNSDDNLYYLSISYRDLKKYKITDISTIDFDIYNKIDKNDINVVFEIESKTNNNKTDKFKSYDLIYSDEYFKLYFDPNYTSDHGNIYVQSIVDEDYYLTFNNADFDTAGYLNDYMDTIDLNNYSITHFNLYFHPCNENMSFVKFEYVIKNDKNEIIKKENVDINYSSAKIKTIYCNK